MVDPWSYSNPSTGQSGTGSQKKPTKPDPGGNGMNQGGSGGYYKPGVPSAEGSRTPGDWTLPGQKNASYPTASQPATSYPATGSYGQPPATSYPGGGSATTMAMGEEGGGSGGYGTGQHPFDGTTPSTPASTDPPGSGTTGWGGDSQREGPGIKPPDYYDPEPQAQPSGVSKSSLEMVDPYRAYQQSLQRSPYLGADGDAWGFGPTPGLDSQPGGMTGYYPGGPSGGYPGFPSGGGYPSGPSTPSTGGGLPPSSSAGYGMPGTDSQPGGASGSGGTGGSYPGGPSSGVTGNAVGSTVTPGGVFDKASTDRAVSQAAAGIFGQADPYSLRVASGGNGLSYGAGQASQINPLLAEAGAQASNAARAIPLGDAFTNLNHLLSGQISQGNEALGLAKLNDERARTANMGNDYLYRALLALMG